jgi:hypothetical protein
MNMVSRFFFAVLFVVSSAMTAAAFGLACFVLINLAPTLIWGEAILMVSPFITGLPSLAAGLFVSVWFFKNVLEWLNYGLQPPRKSPSVAQIIFMGITIVSGAAAIFIVSHGLYPQFFDLAWREEIRLGNGEVKVVETRRTYERPGFRLNEFKDARLHSTQLSFEAIAGGPKVSVKTQLQPVYLNQLDGVWYLVLVGQDDGLKRTLRHENWGGNYNTLGQRLAILNGSEFEPVPWEKAPGAIVFHNLSSTDIFDLAKAKAAENHVMTLGEKQTLMYRYVNTPPGPDPLRITRSDAMKTPLRAEYEEAIAGLVKPP